MAEGKKLIYAADDEQDILDVMREFLQNGGFSVRTFSTGDALYEAFLKEPCDLAVLDIMMPGTDGLTICKKLREISSVPIVILTAKESETDHMRGFMLGSDDYKRLFRPLSRRFEKFSPVTAPILRRSVPAAFPVENVSRCVDRHSDVARAPRGCSTSLICAPSRFSRSSTV